MGPGLTRAGCSPEWLSECLGGWQFGETGILGALCAVLDLRGAWWECGVGHAFSGTNIVRSRRMRAVLVDSDADAIAYQRKRNPDATSILATVTEDTIDKLVPHNCSVCVLDVDGPEYYLLRAMKRRPSVLCVEHMDIALYPRLTEAPEHATKAIIPPLDVCGTRDGNSYCVQASAKAIYDLLTPRGYNLVCLTRINGIYVERSLYPVLESRRAVPVVS